MSSDVPLGVLDATELDRQRRVIMAMGRQVAYWRDLALSDDLCASRADLLAGEPEVPSYSVSVMLPAGWSLEPMKIDPDCDLCVVRHEVGITPAGAAAVQAVWNRLWIGKKQPVLLILCDPKMSLENLDEPYLTRLGIQRLPLPVMEGESANG